MKISKKFLAIFMTLVLLVSAPCCTYEAEAATIESQSSSGEGGIKGFINWIISQVLSFFTSFFEACKEVPDFNSFTSASMQLNVGTGAGTWVSTGISVPSGKAMQIHWTTQGISANVRKYMVMYRIDPRFSRPQTFILQYNYLTGSYDSDFHTYQNGLLAGYQLTPAPTGANFTNMVQNYSNYFNFQGRTPIEVSTGDVVNISLATMNDFIDKSPLITGELDPVGGGLMSIFTSTGLPDNKIMYLDAVSWCMGGNAGDSSPYICGNTGLPGNSNSYFYNTTNQYIMRAVGKVDLNPNRASSLPICPTGAQGPNFQTPQYTGSPSTAYSYSPCLYDMGRTMAITDNNKIIKPVYTPFTHSAIQGSSFFNYVAVENGNLDFADPNATIPIDSMYYIFYQHMSDWGAKYGTSTTGISNFLISNNNTNGNSRILYAGRYIMNIIIGNGNIGGFSQQDEIGVEYQVIPNGPQNKPGTASGTGTSVSQDYAANTPSAGILWLRVINPNTEVTGTITVGFSYYTGTTFLSDVIYNSIIYPVQTVIFNTSKLFYSALAINPTLQWATRLLLTLYIIHISIYFLAGMREVTLNSLLENIIKIAVVVALLTETSWNFFYNNMFRVFLEGMGYLFNNVIGLTSNVNNPFGFVDVIFEKYTNSQLWVLLLSQLLSITNGLTFFSLMIIFCIFTFVGVVLEVVIAYIFAYVVIAVLISLAPLFIICMLFEKTRGIFDNWISLMFNYMIQPTVLLIFFLLIDQLMTAQLSQSLVRACWGYLIKYEISISMDWIGLGTWTFAIPGITGIPGLVPDAQDAIVPGPTTQSIGTFMGIVTGTTMFYLYTQVAAGLSGYVTQIVAALTNASPATGKGGQSPIKAISGQIKDVGSKVGKAVTAPVRAVGRELKEKLWDGKIKTEAPGLNKRDGGKGSGGEDKAKENDKRNGDNTPQGR